MPVRNTYQTLLAAVAAAMLISGSAMASDIGSPDPYVLSGLHQSHLVYPLISLL